MSLTTSEPVAARAPLIKTVADPPSELLMTLRALVDKDEDIKSFFIRFRSENKSVEWLRDIIAAPLYSNTSVDWTFDQVVDACQYLADEYNQLPTDGIFMVNTETGKTEAVFSEDDLIDPGLLPRESGGVAQALRRIRPDKEVAVISYAHGRGHEKKVLQELVRRNPQNQLQKDEGDQRFRMATRSGRKAIAKDLSEEHPRRLLESAGGTVGHFLRHFHIQDASRIPEGYIKIEGTASYRSQIGVQDGLTNNIRYNRLGNLKGAAAQGWVRSMLVELSKKAHDTLGSYPQDFDEFDVKELAPQDGSSTYMWAMDPDTMMALKRKSPKTSLFPVEGIRPIGLTADVGWLEVASGFSVESHERFQRWEVVANLPYVLHVNSKWGGLRTLNLMGLVAEADAEVV